MNSRLYMAPYGEEVFSITSVNKIQNPFKKGKNYFWKVSYYIRIIKSRHLLW